MSKDGSSAFYGINGARPLFSFIDADNIKCGFEQALVRRGISRSDLDVFDVNRLFWMSSSDRYYVFSATEENKQPEQWLTDLRATQKCIFRAGKLTVKRNIRKQQGVDVLLAVEALRSAYNSVYGTCIIFSSDGDMLPLIDEIVNLGKAVTVASFGDPDQSVVASHMRDSADTYIHIGSTILADCIKQQHKANSMGNIEISTLETLGNIEKCSIDTSSSLIIYHNDGQVTFSQDPNLTGYTDGTHRFATFGSLRGAKSWIKLRGRIFV